jgi:hypothetical protein
MATFKILAARSPMDPSPDEKNVLFHHSVSKAFIDARMRYGAMLYAR